MFIGNIDPESASTITIVTKKCPPQLSSGAQKDRELTRISTKK